MPPVGPAAYARTSVVSASNGHGFLVVTGEWRDRTAVCGLFADAHGRPLADSMFIINSSSIDTYPVAVASDGDRYLVAYVVTAINGHQSLKLACVDDHGVVTSRETSMPITEVSLVWSGSAYVLMGTVNRAPVAAVVASDGTVLRAYIPLIAGRVDAFRLSPGPAGQVLATWTGADNAVHSMLIRTSELQNGTYVMPVAESGAAASTFVPVSSAATGGNQSLVVWSEIGTFASTIRARRLDANGRPLGRPFTLVQTNREPWEIAVASSGSGFIVGHSHFAPRGGAFLRVSAGDQVTLLRELSSEPDDDPMISLAGSSGDALMLWNGSRLDGAVTSAPDEVRLFAPARAAQNEPSIAWCGDAYRAVWTEWSPRSAIVFGRLRAGGAPMDAEGRRIDDSSRSQRLPMIACSASNAFVVWKELLPSGSWIARGALVDADRTPHAAFDLGALPDDARPVVTSNGSEYVAAWPSRETNDLMLMRISRDGQPFAAAPLVRGVAAFEPFLAWNGSEYLAVWRWPLGLEAVRLTRELTPVGQVLDIAADNAKSPLVIAGDHEWLIAWTGHYARLSPALELIASGSSIVAVAPVDGMFDGTSYQLVYAGLSDAVAISHGGTSPLLIHRRTADELLPRLYVSPVAVGRPRAAGH